LITWLNLIGDVLRVANGSSVSLMLRASSKSEAETLLRGVCIVSEFAPFAS